MKVSPTFVLIIILISLAVPIIYAQLVPETRVIDLSDRSKDFFFQVSLEDVSGHTAVLIESENEDIDSGVEEDIWIEGGELVYLDNAEVMNISSDSALDTLLGVGGRVLLIEGLDQDYNKISELVNLSGTTVVQTTNSYLRVRMLTITSSGDSETNNGTIRATSAGNNTVQASMKVGESVSKNSQYTVPSGTSAIALGGFGTSHRTTGGPAPLVEFRGLSRAFGTNTWINSFEVDLNTETDSSITVQEKVTDRIPARTDIRLVVEADQNNINIHGRFFFVEVAD